MFSDTISPVSSFMYIIMSFSVTSLLTLEITRGTLVSAALNLLLSSVGAQPLVIIITLSRFITHYLPFRVPYHFYYAFKSGANNPPRKSSRVAVEQVM